MGYIEFKNYHSFNWGFFYNPSTMNTRLTRGGPMLRYPNGLSWNANYGTDSRKRISASTYVSHDETLSGPRDASWSTGLFVEYRPSTSLTISAGPDYSVNQTSFQHVGSYADPTATETFGSRYLFGDLDQTTVSANIRANWIFSPRLSLEVFAQPFVSSGEFSAVHALAEAGEGEFLTYGEDGASTIDESGGDITVDADGVGAAPSHTFGNPDFTFASLRGNAVLRWEYLPGSTLFFVWTQDRSYGDGSGTFEPGNTFRDLFDRQATNIFAVKATYYWRP